MKSLKPIPTQRTLNAAEKMASRYGTAMLDRNWAEKCATPELPVWKLRRLRKIAIEHSFILQSNEWARLILALSDDKDHIEKAKKALNPSLWSPLLK